MSTPQLCAGEDLRCCASCWRHVDHHPDAPPARLIYPATREGKCADWKALPFGAADATQSRL